MPRTAAMVGLVIAVLISGCAGLGPSATQSPPETRGTPSESVGTPDATPPENTVEFEELTDRQQSAFRAAQDAEIRFVPNSSYIHDPDAYELKIATPFQQHDYVQYRETVYRLVRGQGELFATYIVRADPADPPPNVTIDELEDVPMEVRDEVRTALTEGAYNSPLGKWNSIPDPIAAINYIEYENRTYELNYGVGDSWAMRMTVTKSEQG